MDDATIRARVGEVEEAIASLERLPSAPRETALGAFASLLDLYGEAWARALDHLERACPGSVAELAEDELVGHLLMVHGLHPLSVERRVRRAVAEVEEAADGKQVEVELVEIAGGVARLRLNGPGVPGASRLQELIEAAVRGAAPELERVEIDFPALAVAGRPPALVQIQLSRPGRERTGVEGNA